MNAFQGRLASGAPGGYWDVQDEEIDPNVVRQRTPNCCGPACAEMLFKSRGIQDVSQEMVIEAQGDEWSYPESLSAAMNQLQQRLGRDLHGEWRGAQVDIKHSPKQTFESLLKRGPFLTSLKSFNSESHMVVIDGLDDRGRISIRDPWEGTKYAMTWQSFEDVWQGLSVWWSERSQA